MKETGSRAFTAEAASWQKRADELQDKQNAGTTTQREGTTEHRGPSLA